MNFKELKAKQKQLLQEKVLNVKELNKINKQLYTIRQQRREQINKKIREAHAKEKIENKKEMEYEIMGL